MQKSKHVDRRTLPTVSVHRDMFRSRNMTTLLICQQVVAGLVSTHCLNVGSRSFVRHVECLTRRAVNRDCYGACWWWLCVNGTFGTLSAFGVRSELMSVSLRSLTPVELI